MHQRLVRGRSSTGLLVDTSADVLVLATTRGTSVGKSIDSKLFIRETDKGRRWQMRCQSLSLSVCVCI